MSASPMARQVTENKTIPTKRVFINDPSELPHSYSSTPGGTLYSTTPGGTKIVYEKSLLMNLRNSPIAKTPPRFEIPESMMRGKPNSCPNNVKRCTKNGVQQTTPKTKNGYDHEDQFQIDI